VIFLKSTTLRNTISFFLCAIICIFAGLVPVPAASASTNDIRVTLDGTPIRFDVPPQMISGRTMVPLRAIFEELGSNVLWDAESQTATATTGSGDIIILTMGSQTIYINGNASTMDVAPQVINGRTLVPTRFVAQATGLDVGWNASSRTVVIETPIDAAFFEKRVFELINLERAIRGLSPLLWDDGLAAAARSHSVDMATNNFSGMTGSNGSTIDDRLAAAGVTMRSGGQVVAHSHRTPEAAAEQLLSNNNSNLFRDDATHIGAGFHSKHDSRFRFYINVNIGRSNDTLRELRDYPPLSGMTLPNRKLTTEELSTWIDEYHAQGGPNKHELEVVQILNQEREKAGRRPLSIEPTLMMVARFKSQYMADLNYIGHTGVYGQPWDLAEAFGYTSRSFGENLARGQRTAVAAMEDLMNSPGHKDNILDITYNLIGVGFYVSDRFSFHWTQMFSS